MSDGTISLKFLLETRLKSKSFDTLDDMLGFQVQSYDLKQGSLNYGPQAKFGPRSHFIRPVRYL